MRVAIIPARSGSQRIPHKNIKEFQGVPIIGRVISLLKSCELFDQIIVSTDGEEVARVSRRFGADTPFIRPSKLSDGYTDTQTVIRHAISTLGISDPKAEYCCVYPTSVLLTLEILKETHAIFSSGLWEFVLTASRIEPSPLRGFTRQEESGGIQMLNPEFWNYRSQDLPVSYNDAGLLYWANKSNWMQESPIFSRRSTFLEIPNDLVVDINDLKDWELAESIFQKRNSGRDGGR